MELLFTAKREQDSQIREIGFPSLFSTYVADLTETIRRNGAPVELRGLQKEITGDGCRTNLLWARSKGQ